MDQLQQLHNRRYSLAMVYAQLGEDLDCLPPPLDDVITEKRRRVADRQWNVLQDIKGLSEQIATAAVQPPTPAENVTPIPT